MYASLLLLLLPLFGLRAQPDTLLQAYHWQEEGGERRLLLTPDATFQLDYGPGTEAGRYLMGRYRLDAAGRQLTLSVDYFLGKSRIHPRYRDGQDFYLVYDIVKVTERRLVLLDVLTDDLIAFLPTPLSGDDDPARRRIPKPKSKDWGLPEGWGG
ncbi:hypothetical protein CLV84_1150 [Neolewinella xylanilytica]|uniref:Uncharacterized protein n=1 Tax=Neolewinella xylanilytica TaxID=1514080 RepID=A0A2S6I9L0_9BACT|nr:hypothetical protein [Neolewinella xylanilytica]PPK88185.1 hypothetical protein CLV84_1150 [Neolewinella xylanilytica]